MPFPWLDKRERQDAAPVLPVSAMGTSDAHDHHPSTQKKKSVSFRNISWASFWAAFKERLGSGSALSESLLLESGDLDLEKIDPALIHPLPNLSANNENNNTPADEDEGPIDEIVVDNLMSSDETTHRTPTDLLATGTGGSPEKPVPIHESHPGTTGTDNDGNLSISEFAWVHSVWTAFRWRLYPTIERFFFLQFQDEAMEAQFSREVWFTTKQLALWASLFYVLNWIIGCVLLPAPHPLMERIYYWGIAPVITLPLVFFVAFDFRRRYNLFYQIYLACATWSWVLYQCLFLILCGFYPGQKMYFSCSGRDFLGLLYYASALPAISLFALGQQRLFVLFPAIGVVVVMSVWIVPFRHTWARSVLNVFVFQMFLLWLHYLRENADRRLYSLREQLKIQFRATQKAQINERQAADSKRRLTSYIFHEVRVPLNTALLAVQNMEANDSIPKGQEIEFAALEGSLSMMSKVLNDVLDFNRMDSGRFESVNRPYTFHTALRSMLVPLQLAADVRGLELCTDMDKRLDETARRAWYRALDESPEWIEQKLREHPNEEGIVVGDEMRLRQIITNLTSNACKFTSTGGKITVRTKLLYPVLKSAEDQEPSVKSMNPSLSAFRLSQHDALHSPHSDNIVVRIEIEDTGVGIRARDLVDKKLFSPYVQTEIGRRQGGKGTGLGLALVRHIVQLSGGRLGVRSQLGVGSTFWVELRLGVGKRALAKHGSATGSDIIADAHLYSDFQKNVMFDTSTMNHAARRYKGSFPVTARTSALKSIMDQGGLVELAPRRSLMSTGQRLPLTRSDTETPSSSETTAVELDYMPAKSSASTSRPTFIALPERETMNTSNALPTPVKPPSPPYAAGGKSIGTSSSSPRPSLHLDTPLHALVVDDDGVTRQLMSRLLARLGVTVTCAENGAVALDLILSTNCSPSKSDQQPSIRGDGSPEPSAHTDNKYDIIFLDNQMPVMTGLEVIQKLRSLGRSDFVVGVTGNALLSDQEEYLEAGVNRVLTKPVHERNLKTALNAADILRKQASTPKSELGLDSLEVAR